jgi:hypothetical protein
MLEGANIIEEETLGELVRFSQSISIYPITVERVHEETLTEGELSLGCGEERSTETIRKSLVESSGRNPCRPQIRI